MRAYWGFYEESMNLQYFLVKKVLKTGFHPLFKLYKSTLHQCLLRLMGLKLELCKFIRVVFLKLVAGLELC